MPAGVAQEQFILLQLHCKNAGKARVGQQRNQANLIYSGQQGHLNVSNKDMVSVLWNGMSKFKQL